MEKEDRKETNKPFNEKYELDYVPLTNDLLFHMVFSKNKAALHSLLSSLLGIPESEIVDVLVLNPIQYTEAIDTKVTVLDLKLHLNGDRFILIEMQVRRFTYWTNRSVVYTCRQLVDQTRGKYFRYSNLQPVIQISIMNHTLFPDHKRFFTKYELKDEEGYQYTDKLQFIVMDLTAINDATENDKKQGLVEWAEAFTAKTWDSVEQIENEGVKEARKTMELIMATPTERQLLMDRELAELDRQAWLEDALAEGLEKGMAEGMEKGMAEGMEKGMEKGMAEGMEKGMEEGRDEMANLISKLFDMNRFEDIKRCTTDPHYRNQLIREMSES